MHQTPLLRLLALFAVLSLAAVACSSSDSSDAATTPAGSDETDESTVDRSSEDEPETESAAPDGPVDPESARDLVRRLTGLDVEGEELTCLVDKSTSDNALSSVFNSWQDPNFQFTPEAFTILTVNVHGCVEPVKLSGTLVALTGGAGDAGAFVTCLATEFSNEQDGDLSYVGLSALQVSFPVPEGAQEAAIDTASKCITGNVLANQLAVSREQAAGFTVEVDRDCVSEGLDESFSQSFWEGVVTGEPGDTAEIEPLIEDCTQEFDSGLPKEVPADFEPFAGEGVLAGIDPATRNGIYSAAPSMTLQDGVDYQALVTTSDGTMTIDLFEDTAPVTVNAFVALARDGYYDGTRFHRVLDGFMAQAGDPTSTGSGGPGFQFDDEASGLTPIDKRGLLAMANSGPDTNGSQFFITLDAADWLDGLHTVFGEVVEGDDVLSQIDLRDPQAPTNRGEELISVEIVEA